MPSWLKILIALVAVYVAYAHYDNNQLLKKQTLITIELRKLQIIALKHGDCGDE